MKLKQKVLFEPKQKASAVKGRVAFLAQTKLFQVFRNFFLFQFC